MGVVQDGTAKSGSAFLRARTTTPGGSVASDFWATTLTAGGTSSPEPSIGAMAWLRAKPGGPAISGIMALWQLDPGISVSSGFTVGNEWTLVTNVIDLVPDVHVNIGMRVEFYIGTVNADLDIDNVIVV